MTVHDDKSLDAQLDTLRDTPAPRVQLRHNVMADFAREPRETARGAEPHAPRSGSLLDALAALWRELGGARLAGPAFAMALAAGIGLSWFADNAAAGEDDGGDDLVALAQLDDAYAGLEP